MFHNHNASKCHGVSRELDKSSTFNTQKWYYWYFFFFIVWDLRHLDGFIRVGDEGDEERQHHVDEQWDERVEVSPTEEPHQRVLVLQLGEGGEHVVAVEEREQTLGHTAQLLELERRRINKLLLLRISSAVDRTFRLSTNIFFLYRISAIINRKYRTKACLDWRTREAEING